MTDTASGLDAWTAPALAAAIGVDQSIAAEVVQGYVEAGEMVRLTSGPHEFFVLGGLGEVLTKAGAVPVEGERLHARRTWARGLRVGARLRGAVLRDRAADEKGKGA